MWEWVIALWLLMDMPPVTALKAASFSVVIATVLLTFLHVRHVYGTWQAIVVTAMLSVSGWHLMMQFAGWRAILVPLFVVMTLHTLTMSATDKRTRWYIAAGATTGAALYTYEAARLLPLLTAAFTAVEWKRHGVAWHNAGAMAGAFILIAAPLAIHVYDEPAFFDRTTFLMASPSDWASQTKAAVGALCCHPAGGDFFRHAPILSAPAFLAMTVGTAFFAANIRKPERALTLAMLASGVAIGVVSWPNANRMILAMLPVYIVAGVGLCDLASLIARRLPRWQVCGKAAVAIMLAWCVHAGYSEYVGPDRRVPHGFNPDAYAVAMAMREVPRESRIHLLAVDWPQDTILLVNDDLAAGDYEYHQHPQEFLDALPSHSRPAIYIIEYPTFADIVNAMEQAKATEPAMLIREPAAGNGVAVLLEMR